MTIKETVAKNLEALRTLDQRALTVWAKAHGMDSRAGFASFKRALAANGIDYDALRAERLEGERAALEAAVTHEVILFSDAKARTARFGICDQKGQPVWYGQFFDDDRDFNGEQSSGEMAAAKKAVWLASKIAAAVGGTVRLTLNVDAEWLCHANATNGTGGKALELARTAQKLGIVLKVQHVPGEQNPADAYTVCQGHKRWQDNDLPALAA